MCTEHCIYNVTCKPVSLHRKEIHYLFALLLRRDLSPRSPQRKSAAVVGGWTTATSSIITAIVTCIGSHL